MFKYFLIFTLLISVSFGGVLPPEFTEWEGRIVGGSTADRGQFPYIVSLRTNWNSHFCGGSIMSNRWVVSAAHCTTGRTDIQVAVGAHKIFEGTLIPVSTVIDHPSYDARTLSNDICLIQTATAIVFSDTVAPIPLGSVFITEGIARASGWGQTSNPGSLALTLQYVDKSVMTVAACQQRWGATRINNGNICTTAPVGVGVCIGDSGGPLVQDGQLLGAVSFGSACARGMPDVYSRVSFYRTWLIRNAV